MANNVVSFFSRKNSKIKDNAEISEQISLPFMPRHNLLLLLFSHFDEPGLFQRFASKTQPCMMIDMRSAPRLDFVASTRRHSFRVLEEMDISYVDMLGQFDFDKQRKSSKDYQMLWSAVAKMLSAIPVGDRPIFYLFDDSDLMQKFKATFQNGYDVAYAGKQFVQDIADEVERLRM